MTPEQFLREFSSEQAFGWHGEVVEGNLSLMGLREESICLQGLRVEGNLYLAGMECDADLYLEGLEVTGYIHLGDAKVGARVHVGENIALALQCYLFFGAGKVVLNSTAAKRLVDAVLNAIGVS